MKAKIKFKTNEEMEIPAFRNYFQLGSLIVFEGVNDKTQLAVNTDTIVSMEIENI